MRPIQKRTFRNYTHNTNYAKIIFTHRVFKDKKSGNYNVAFYDIKTRQEVIKPILQEKTKIGDELVLYIEFQGDRFILT